MTIQSCQTLKRIGHDDDVVVTATGPGAGVPGVPGAIVLEFEMTRRQARTHETFDLLGGGVFFSFDDRPDALLCSASPTPAIATRSAASSNDTP